LTVIAVEQARAGERYARERDHIETAFPDLAGVTDRGLRRRHNEDAMALARVEGHGARVIVVCDGVSASAEPAMASQTAADAALAHLVAAVRNGRLDPEVAMTEAVAAAHRAVCAVPYQGDTPNGPPASTLVAALLRDQTATVGWVGDSRAYFVSSTEAWQLTHDDSWAADQVQLGLMSEEAAGADPRAHVLTRWLGRDHEAGTKPSVSTFQIHAGGCLLLCSDGLWNYAPTPDHIRGLLVQLPFGASPLDVTQGLTQFARSSGGMDNVTVAVAVL
jgi:serine/threonine protein phosphatase PrpC